MLTPEDIFCVYKLTHDDGGEPQWQLGGRFAFLGDDIAVLEDPFGILEGLDGPVDAWRQRRLRHLRRSAYTRVVRTGDVGDGTAPDLLPEEDFDHPGRPSASGDATPSAVSGASVGATPPPPPVWDYQRAGMHEPATLEFDRGSGSAILNGQRLTDEELQQLLSNVDSGTATLRYRHTQTSLPGVAKVEGVLTDLVKAEDASKEDEDLFGVLQHLKDLAARGHIDPQQIDVLHRALYGDQLLGHTIGNKRAYADFLSRPKEGVHVMMDANDFKSINDELGHGVGDKALRAMGDVIRGALDETVGREHGKAFRFGGDEFAAHVPTYEHAAAFARALRARLEAVPPLGGTHRLSMSMGIGHTPEAADYALNMHAKDAKNRAVAALSGKYGSRQAGYRAPEALYAHSLFPGKEGAIPTTEAPVDIAAAVRPPVDEPPRVSPFKPPLEPQGTPAAAASVSAAPAEQPPAAVAGK